MFHYPLLWLARETGLWSALNPAGQFAIAAIALLLTVAIASLSYRYFEKPLLFIKNRFETVRTRPA